MACFQLSALVILVVGSTAIAAASPNTLINSPLVLLNSWADAFESHDIDGLSGNAVSWSWLRTMCQTFPCSSTATSTELVSFEGNTYSAEVSESSNLIHILAYYLF